MNALELNDFVKGFGPLKTKVLYEYERYSDNIKEQQLPEEDVVLSAAANAFIQQRLNIEAYRRILPLVLRPRFDSVMMLSIKDGYLRSSNTKLWSFLKDLYEFLYTQISNDDERGLISTLGVNYSKGYPYTILPHYNSDYEVDYSYYDTDAMNVCERAWSKYEHNQLKEATWMDARFRVLKTTAMGFRNETVDGIPIKREDVLYGLQDDVLFEATRYRRDYSQVKLGYWVKDYGCRQVFLKQCELAQTGISVQNIGRIIDENLISVCTAATRENNPDQLSLQGKMPLDKPIWAIKDRAFSIHKKTPFGTPATVQTHKVISGVINSKEYNVLAFAEHKQPGAANKWRGIWPSNNSSQGMWTGYARIATHKIEEGSSGMPSNRPVVMARWAKFFDVFGDTHDVYVFFGDCKNAELTVNTNFKLFLQLVPKAIQPYLDVTSCTLTNTTDGFHVRRNSYCSAVWYTTYFHLHKGNFEAPRIIHHTLKRLNVPVYSLPIVVDSFMASLLYATPFAKIGENTYICPFLATDDMMMPIAVPKGSPTLQADAKMLAATMMGAGFTKDVHVAFGMKGTPSYLTVNESNRLSKLFTSEHMGDVFKDGMATYERVHNCGYTKEVDYMLRKHFNFDHGDYHICETLFLQRLEKLGINIGDVFDIEHSPVGKMLYGKFVTEDPMLSKSIVPEEYATKSLDLIKKILIPRFEEHQTKEGL